uniref:Uncharacterized protein n=1 Tax=Myotis myotis TaxID=51298 RepID=A0A7J7VYT6_MYOMY|nr:hypothetical protein mMyoMyo1_012387 [Myotis myotis]
MGAQPGSRVEADPRGLGGGRDPGLLVPIEIASQEGQARSEPSNVRLQLWGDPEGCGKGAEGRVSFSCGSSSRKPSVNAPISSCSESELKTKSNEQLKKKQTCVSKKQLHRPSVLRLWVGNRLRATACV